MSLQIQRPATIDVTKVNPRGTIYLNSVDPILTPEEDDLPDGSLRILIDEVDPKSFEFERKADGVWNTTDINIAAQSLFVGRDVSLSGAGGLLVANDLDIGESAVLLHHHFDDSGTDPLPHATNFAPKIFRLVVQPDDSEERINTLINSLLVSPVTGIRTKLYYKTGTVGATAPVTLEIQKDSQAGFTLFKRQFSASVFATPLVEVEIELPGFVQAEAGETLSITWTSDELFSIRGNASNQNWVALDLFLTSEESVVTVEEGMNRVVNNNLGDTIASNSGNLILSGGIAT